jgi:hypothetical protein
MAQTIEIAKLLNVKYDKDNDRLFLTMEVFDPVWKRKILREWQNMEVSLVFGEKNEKANS